MIEVLESNDWIVWCPVTLSRVRDFVIYISVGVLVLVGVYLYAEHRGPNTDAVAKWAGLVVTTLILFGYILKEVWKERRHKRFWLTLFLLLSVHSLLWSLVLAQGENVKPLALVMFFPIEHPLIVMVLMKCIVKARAKPRGHHG